MLGISDLKSQEIYDEVMILKLAEYKDENGFQNLVLTDAGKRRLFRSYYLKEHQKIIRSTIRETFVVVTTFVLALTALLQTCEDKSPQTLNEMQNINKSLKEIDTTIRNSVHP